MSTTRHPNRIRTMDDLKFEKYKLKVVILKSESNVLKDWNKLKSSFNFSNLSELLGEQLFPGTYSKVKSGVLQFSGLWNGLFTVLLERLIKRFSTKKD